MTARSGFTVSATENLCFETRPDSCGLVVFGASGDLARRKLIPSLFGLYSRHLLADGFRLVGVARTPLSTESFQARVREDILRAHPGAASQRVEAFCSLCRYAAGEYQDATLYTRLAAELGRLNAPTGGAGNVIFYLSVPPDLCGGIIQRLAGNGLTAGSEPAQGWRRVVIEKPFGHDLASAVSLDQALHQCLDENQIYRIDHYLGKDTVQNVLMLRFANAIFEPVWSRQYVDHVQITVAESIGVGTRTGYYDRAGCLRDMFQNHVLQLLSLVAMEPPPSFDADRVRDEKVKLLRCVRPLAPADVLGGVVRGQYVGKSGAAGSDSVPGYLQEPGVGANSMTETYAAMRLLVDNWRWQGVPFYLRSGKRLARRVSEIAISFRQVPHSIFTPLLPEHLGPDLLVLNVQPEDGVSMSIQAKKPGPKLCIGTLTMAFRYRDVFGADPPEAYERLLLDCMLGDQTLFARRDHIELSWALLGPILETWADPSRAPTACPLHSYTPGSWGPAAAEDLLTATGRAWRTP